MGGGNKYELRELLRDQPLTLLANTDSLDDAFDIFVAGPASSAGPLFIGIDGSVTAGKSHVATELQAYLTKRQRDCVTIRGDWFMLPRSVRKAEIEKASSPDYNIRNYDPVACNYPLLTKTVEKVVAFQKSGVSEIKLKISDAYNRRTGELDETIKLALNKNTIVVIEGTGLLDEYRGRFFDIRIRADIRSYEEAASRLMQRELAKDERHRLSSDFVRERYDLIDYPYDQFLRSKDRGQFTYLLDTSLPKSIDLYKRTV